MNQEDLPHQEGHGLPSVTSIDSNKVLPSPHPSWWEPEGASRNTTSADPRPVYKIQSGMVF